MEEPTMKYQIIEVAPDGKEEVVAQVASADFAVHMKEAIEFLDQREGYQFRIDTEVER
jgi:hypothetical protein